MFGHGYDNRFANAREKWRYDVREQEEHIRRLRNDLARAEQLLLTLKAMADRPMSAAEAASGSFPPTPPIEE